MNTGFWGKLEKPIMALAPMADVTDPAFRRIIAKYSKWGGIDIGDGSKGNLPAEAFRVGGPGALFTEFVSADGLCHEKARMKLIKDLVYSESERPIVAQLFTARSEKMEEAAALIEDLGFDGLDINMGCPDRSVEKQGAGAALMKNPELARELIRAARRGAPRLPISVKTRIGYNKDELETWLPELLAEEPAVITIHARTRREMSKVPARWERIAEAVAKRDRLGSKTLIIGNGDVLDTADACQKAEETGADGIMLGRAIFGNPWLFSNSTTSITPTSIFDGNRVSIKKRVGVAGSVIVRLQVLVEHTKLFEELCAHKSFTVMKKHFKAYVAGFDGAKELREQLMSAESAEAVSGILNDFLKMPR